VKDLSLLIPARNEMFLSRTIQDIVEHAEGSYEIIAVLDGEWVDPPVDQHHLVTVIHYPESIGQRAATNRAASVSTGKYLMKVDAHCAFDQGFDVKMLADMQDNWTMAPLMKNLHAFDWVCPECGERIYQGPTPMECPKCKCEEMERDVVWIAKPSPQSTAYRFDRTLHFQYWPEWKKKQGNEMLPITLSLQGSCFMLSREKYFELNICDEGLGSWGNQGTEVACKTWLSGGEVRVSKNTWYAHMFRTQGGDFGFPYPMSGRQVERARQITRDLFLEGKWDKAIHPLSWLLEKFWPIPDWTEDDLKSLREKSFSLSFAAPLEAKASTPEIIKRDRTDKGIVYYTDNKIDPLIMKACQDQILKSINKEMIISVSLEKLSFGDNIVLSLERGYLTMFKQILAGLEASNADIIFFCEHDVLYHPSHFEFTPPRDDTIYYNTNVWKVRYSDGHALHYDCKQTSGLCAYRELLVEHYRKRVANTEAVLKECGSENRNFRNWIRRQGFEPGTHHRNERVDDLGSEAWQSEYPLVDIRHDSNLTPNRWSIDEFRRKPHDWVEADEVKGWGKTKDLMETLRNGR